MARGDLVSVRPLGQNNYVVLPTPSTYRMTSTTLVDSGRNTNGVLVSKVVREGIRKIELEWHFLDQTNFSLIAKLFESSSVGGTGNFMCYLKYYDTIRGTMIDSYTEYVDSNQTIRRQFYVGDRVSDTAQISLDSSGNIRGYANVKLSLIEC